MPFSNFSNENFTKHIGVIKNTNKKVAVVFHVLPGTKDKALVCDLESLPPRLADNMTEIIYSSDAQQPGFFDLYNVLARRLSTDGGIPLINELHMRNYLFAIPHNLVLMTPRPNIVIPLDQLVDELVKNGTIKLEENIEDNTPKEQKEETTYTSSELTEENNDASNDDDENNIFSKNEKNPKLSKVYIEKAKTHLFELTKNIEMALYHNPDLEIFVKENFNNIANKVLEKTKLYNNQYITKKEKVISSNAFSAPKKVRRKKAVWKNKKNEY